MGGIHLTLVVEETSPLSYKNKDVIENLVIGLDVYFCGKFSKF